MSSSEMGKLFDTLTAMSNLMRAQKEVITDLRDSVKELQEDMHELKEDRKTLIEKIEMLTCSNKEMPEDGSKIPLGMSVSEVRNNVHPFSKMVDMVKAY